MLLDFNVLPHGLYFSGTSVLGESNLAREVNEKEWG